MAISRGYNLGIVSTLPGGWSSVVSRDHYDSGDTGVLNRDGFLATVYWSLTYNQWIGLRENLQETINFPIKYGVFP